jgi:leader peptidase (prepilin peptidase)/N-methyltransferase
MRVTGSSAVRANLSDIVQVAGTVVSVGVTLFEVGYPRALPAAGLAVITIMIARSDWRQRIIPNMASLAAAGLALAEALLTDEPWVAALDAVTRGVALFLLFLAFRSAFRLWRGREGMGFGDVKLAGVLGLWLDWPYIPVAIEMACLSAIAYVIASKIVSRQAIDASAKLPFGAFLAPAIWVTWMWQNIAY